VTETKRMNRRTISQADLDTRLRTWRRGRQDAMNGKSFKLPENIADYVGKSISYANGYASAFGGGDIR
jgi:hypothetical protein